MISQIPLSDYFKRIYFRGEAAPTLECLQKLQFQHLKHIPFEKLNPLLGIPVQLDRASLIEKMIHEKRGGYCYEQNILFIAVLQQIGFEARGITSRVILRQPIDHIAQRTHLMTLVKIEGITYICDTGFGAQVLTAPIQLYQTNPQKTTHENYKIERFKHDFVLQAFVQNEWKNLIKFDLQKQYLVDYQVGNWYTSTHLNSVFTGNLIVTRIDEGKRLLLRNKTFTIHHLNRKSEKRKISDLDELLLILRQYFDFIPPKVPGWEAKLQEVLMRT